MKKQAYEIIMRYFNTTIFITSKPKMKKRGKYWMIMVLTEMYRWRRCFQ